MQAAVRFQNGSTGTITYLTAGCPRYPKETFDVSAGGLSARLDNFQKATVWSGRQRRVIRAHGGHDKGQRRELECFLEACRRGAPMPISLECLIATTGATIAAGESLSSGHPERA